MRSLSVLAPFSLALLTLSSSTTASATPASPSAAISAHLRAQSGWARATPPGAHNGVAFCTVVNESNSDDRIVSASSPIAARSEIHIMAVTNGVMTMRAAKDGVAVAKNATVTLAPGGIHVMLLDLKRPLVAGEHVPLTLQLERAGPVVVDVVVGAIDAEGPVRAP